MPNILGALKRLIAYQNETPELAKRLENITSRKPPLQDENEWNKVAIANDLLRNAWDSAKARTHAFMKDDSTKGIYQLQDTPNGTYIPYFLSDQPGLGREMLEDAYFMAPTKPVSLYAIPGSEGFYRKQPNWEESTQDGVSKFTRKASGGLCQMKGK